MNSKEKNEHLVKGITIIFVANIIGTVFNIALNFLLPKYLTVEAYAGIKTYQLYYTYVGIFHFGYIDGVYLEYGGKKFDSIGLKELAIRVNSLRLVELVISVALVVYSFLLKDDIFFYFALSVLPLNMIGFFQVLYQATGEYSRYSKILNITTIMKAIMSVFIIVLISKEDYQYFLIGYVILDIVLWIWLEILLYRKEIIKNFFGRISLNIIFREVKEGIILRIGVLSGFFLSGMDRIFVKIFMDTKAFAQYAFAATVENLLNIIITPITTTLYNYFCNETAEEQVRKIRNIVMVASMYMLLAFFPVKCALNIFLNSYVDATGVLAFLFAAKALYMIVQGVYVNLYKAKKQQSKYLFRLIIVILVGIILNYLFYQIVEMKEAFAVATWVTTFIWLILCVIDFKKVCFNLKESIYLIVGNIVFLVCANLLNDIMGFIAFLIAIMIISFLIMRQEMNAICLCLKKFINSRYPFKTNKC